MEFVGDLRKRNFAGENLAGALFRDADLRHASFAGADLRNAAFLNCLAAEADFRAATCIELRAVESNFYRADFRHTNLLEAHLYKCVLAGADFRGANLKRITLTLDCNSFDDARLDRATGAELAYLFTRARAPQRAKWLEALGERDRGWLERVFAR